MPGVKLLDQVRNIAQVKHMSRRTAQAYVYWIKRFILFHNKRHPSLLGNEEISAFLSHLAVDQRVAASTQNQALNALVFLYKHVLKEEPGNFSQFVRAKRPERLPVALTREEVQKVLAHLEGVSWLMAGLLYGGGLRLLECVRLRIKDIDFGYGQIIVRDGKGEKDRATVLPQSLHELLKLQIEKARLIHTHVLHLNRHAVCSPLDVATDQSCRHTLFKPPVSSLAFLEPRELGKVARSIVLGNGSTTPPSCSNGK